MTPRPTLSYQRLRTEQPLSDEELYIKIKRTVPNKHDSQVLESFLIFNKLVDQQFHSATEYLVPVVYTLLTSGP